MFPSTFCKYFQKINHFEERWFWFSIGCMIYYVACFYWWDSNVCQCRWCLFFIEWLRHLVVLCFHFYQLCFNNFSLILRCLHFHLLIPFYNLCRFLEMPEDMCLECVMKQSACLFFCTCHCYTALRTKTIHFLERKWRAKVANAFCECLMWNVLQS